MSEGGVMVVEGKCRGSEGGVMVEEGKVQGE